MSEEFLESVQEETRQVISDDSAEFSIPCTIRIATDSSTAIEIKTNCIFDETYESVDPDSGATIVSQEPIGIFVRDDIENPEESDVLSGYQTGLQIKIPEKVPNTWRFIIKNKEYLMGGPPIDGQDIITFRFKRDKSVRSTT